MYDPESLDENYVTLYLYINVHEEMHDGQVIVNTSSNDIISWILRDDNFDAIILISTPNFHLLLIVMSDFYVMRLFKFQDSCIK